MSRGRGFVFELENCRGLEVHIYMVKRGKEGRKEGGWGAWLKRGGCPELEHHVELEGCLQLEGGG